MTSRGQHWMDEFVAALEWNRRAKALLRRLEWRVDARIKGPYGTWCPDCGQPRAEGHSRDCELGDLLG